MWTRWGRALMLALVLAALTCATARDAKAGTGDHNIHPRTGSHLHHRFGRQDASRTPVGVGSAGLVDIPFDTKPIEGMPKGDVPTAVPGGHARFLGGLEVTFTSSDKTSSDETPGGPVDPLSYGGWSSVTGNADGSVAWILTDNYARLLRVELGNDERSGALDGVVKMQDATNFSFQSADGAAIERTHGTRIDTESILEIPHADNELGDASIDDFVVGVEDSRVLTPNNLVRFRHGIAGGHVDVPGASEALGNACDVNLGPEALVYLPSRYTFAGSLREGAYPGAVIVAFCEARDESGEIVGFLLDAAPTGGAGVLGTVSLTGLGDDLAPGRFQCGASDATVTPDGSIVIVLFHCYDFTTGDHVSSLRTVKADWLRVPDTKTAVSPLMDWTDPLGNMEGVHAFSVGDANAVGVLMVSDNNLSETSPTQIVEFELRGPLFDESVLEEGDSAGALGESTGGGSEAAGVKMPSPLRHPFRAALWVGVRRLDARLAFAVIGFAAASALIALGLFVVRWRCAVDSRRVDSEVSPLLPR